MKNKISVSVMCADLLHLKKEIVKLSKTNIDYLHWDIMDGVFVPNYSMSPNLMEAVNNICDIKFDTHLMISNPGEYIETFTGVGTDMMVVHSEATNHLHRVIQKIKEKGIKAGVALNPATSLQEVNYILNDLDMILIMTVNPGFAGQKMIPETLNKIEEMKKIIDKRDLEIDLQVDGNVSFENAVKMKKRGANVFVAGSSSVFSEDIELKKGVNKLREKVSI